MRLNSVLFICHALFCVSSFLSTREPKKPMRNSFPAATEKQLLVLFRFRSQTVKPDKTQAPLVFTPSLSSLYGSLSWVLNLVKDPWVCGCIKLAINYQRYFLAYSVFKIFRLVSGFQKSEIFTS